MENQENFTNTPNEGENDSNTNSTQSKETQPENNQVGNNSPSPDLTVEGIQKLIAEALAQFKSEILIKSESTEDREYKEENKEVKERSL